MSLSREWRGECAFIEENAELEGLFQAKIPVEQTGSPTDPGFSLAELRWSPTGWGVVGKQRGKAFFLLGGTGAKTVWHPSLARDLRVMSDAGLPTPCQRGFL